MRFPTLKELAEMAESYLPRRIARVLIGFVVVVLLVALALAGFRTIRDNGAALFNLGAPARVPNSVAEANKPPISASAPAPLTQDRTGKPKNREATPSPTKSKSRFNCYQPFPGGGTIVSEHCTAELVPPPSSPPSEDRRAILAQIRQLYVLSHDRITSELAAGLALPPTDYINDQLAKLHEGWRVRSTDGPNAEIYELTPYKNASSPSLTVQNSPGSIIAPSGGNNTVVNQAPPPELKQLSGTDWKSNADGTVTSVAMFQVVAPYPPANLKVTAYGDAVLDVKIQPQREGLIFEGSKGSGQGYAFDNLEQPYGTLAINVHMTQKAPARVVYLLK
jgi:hypothetical protein